MNDDHAQIAETVRKLQKMVEAKEALGLIEEVRKCVPADKRRKFEDQIAHTDPAHLGDYVKLFKMMVGHLRADLLLTDAAVWTIEGDTAKVTVTEISPSGTTSKQGLSFVGK